MTGTQTLIALTVAFVSIAAAMIGVAHTIAQTVGTRITTLETTLGARIGTLETTLSARIDDLGRGVDRLEDRVAHLERERA